MLNGYFTSSQMAQLDAYYELLIKWNKKHNFTRIIKQTDFIERNVLDCAVIPPHFADQRPDYAIDVGTGAGIPGVILAIMMPDTHWHLVDANLKRVVFLEQVKYHLSLNFTAHHCLIQEKNLPGTTIVTRAVTDPNSMLNITQHLHQPQTKIYMMRASHWGQPLNNHPKWIYNDVDLDIPNSERKRVLMILSQKAGTESKFPIH